MSTAGATVLGVGYLLPMIYLLWSMRYGKPAPEILGTPQAWSGRLSLRPPPSISKRSPS